jgi:hypothetical protein
MKYNKYNSKGELKDHLWREGKNIAKVVNFSAAPPPHKMDGGQSDPYPRHTIYDVRLNNIYGKQIRFGYLVPVGAEPHQLLRDLLHFYQITPKPWVIVTLNYNLEKKLPQIVSLQEVKDMTQEEMEQKSLDERGGRVSLN